MARVLAAAALVGASNPAAPGLANPFDLFARPAKPVAPSLPVRPGDPTWWLSSQAAPFASMVAPAGALAPIDAKVVVGFSRPMAQAPTARLFRIEPHVEGTLSWPDDHTMLFEPGSLAYDTSYEVSLDGLSKAGANLLGARIWGFRTQSPPPNVRFPFTLTFDDCGPPAQLHAILDALDARGLKAIFFPTGICRDTYPWLVPEILARGHRACNHTYSHPQLPRLGNGAVAAEIARGVHTDCRLFRPPFGAWDGPRGRIAAVAAQQGFVPLLWDVDTRDWAFTSADYMVGLIRARGGIVLMHLHAGTHTVEAIRAL